MGRQKLFERGDVTDKALHVFWQKGYVDTSLKDLEEATGVFKPALYSEFGDKEGLFLECVRYYRDHYAGRLQLEKAPYGWGNIEDFLRFTYRNKFNHGCFETLAFARDVPILPEKLKPLLDENVRKITAAIAMNLSAAGVRAQNLPSLTGMVFTYYCGLSALSSALPRTQLEKSMADFLKLIRE